MKDTYTIFLLLMIIPALAISFFINAALVWLVCQITGWVFTWPRAAGVWVGLIILKALLSWKKPKPQITTKNN